MKYLETISSDEMVAIILKAEITSKRVGYFYRAWLKKKKLPRSLVTKPDITNRRQNRQRRKMLGRARGYRRNKLLFEKFPKRVTWQRVIMSREELRQVFYLRLDDWTELTGGSRLVADAAYRIRRNKLPKKFRLKKADFVKAANAWKEGYAFEQIILAGEPNGRLVILEGHLRLSAYFVAGKKAPEQVTVIIGTSEKMNRWVYY